MRAEISVDAASGLTTSRPARERPGAGDTSGVWLFDAVDSTGDVVFGEVLEGLLQLTGADSAAITLDVVGTVRSVARVPVLGDGLLPDRRSDVIEGAAHVAAIEVQNGPVGLELKLWARQAIAEDRLTDLPVLISMLGRLLAERRAARLPRDAVWGLMVLRDDGEIRSVSPRVCELMGYSPGDVLGRNIFDVIHPDDHALAIDSFARTVTVPGEKYPLDVRFVCRDGSSRVWEVTGEARDGYAAGGIVFTARPVDGRSDDDALIGDQARVLDMIGRGERIESTLGEIARLASRRLGAACAVLRVESTSRTLRLVAEEGIGPGLRAVLDGTPIAPTSNTCGLAVHLRSAIRSADLLGDESWSTHRAVLETAGVGSCWADPIDSARITDPLGVLAFFGDQGWLPTPQDVRAADLFASIASVTIQRAHAEAELQRSAMHDPLTGLPNRALFLDRLERALSVRHARNTAVAVMFLDLDRFKVINDALGHEVGDELLLAVAERINSVTRQGTSVARFGGDEFTVLVESVRSPRDALAIADRVIEAFREPVLIGGHEIVMTVSIGVVMSGAEHVKASTMLRDADAAMYRAKHRGRNRVELFDDRMRAFAVARLDLEHALQRSVERGEFSLHYQPEVDLGRLQVVGTEALLRWSHPVRGAVSPADFIPVAEETGAIIELGEWVLLEACRQLARWDEVEGAPAPRMWVNMSVVQLLQPGFPLRVKRMLEATGTSPERLGLEVTESALMTDVDAAIKSLVRLRELGIHLALDDFGTGYASLASLRRLPVDLVKIDQTFVKDMAGDPRGMAVFAAIVDLVHATDAHVVAEGVETEEQFAALRELGCDGAQGYWIGRPAAATELAPAWSWAG